MILYETLLPAITDNREAIHQFNDSLLKPRGAPVEREYLWSFLPSKRKIVIRKPESNGLINWCPMPEYHNGERVRGRLHADAGTGVDTPLGHCRRPRIGYERNMVWFERQMIKAGLDLLDCHFVPELTDMSFHGCPFPGYLTARFTFLADVVDEQRLHEVLRTGLGNAKCYGLGFLFLMKEP